MELLSCGGLRGVRSGLTVEALLRCEEDRVRLSVMDVVGTL